MAKKQGMVNKPAPRPRTPPKGRSGGRLDLGGGSYKTAESPRKREHYTRIDPSTGRPRQVSMGVGGLSESRGRVRVGAGSRSDAARKAWQTRKARGGK